MTKQNKVESIHKPQIETLINTAAIALTSYGIFDITSNSGWSGYVAIGFAMLLEWSKYFGRSKNLW